MIKLFNRLNPFAFFLAFCVGLFLCYVTAPKPTVLIKYPTPETSGLLTFIDDASIRLYPNINEDSKLLFYGNTPKINMPSSLPDEAIDIFDEDFEVEPFEIKYDSDNPYNIDKSAYENYMDSTRTAEDDARDDLEESVNKVKKEKNAEKMKLFGPDPCHLIYTRHVVTVSYGLPDCPAAYAA